VGFAPGVPAIHIFFLVVEGVDARHKAGMTTQES
jgi:hypothetical protein